jgi:hypothetical protein
MSLLQKRLTAAILVAGLAAACSRGSGGNEAGNSAAPAPAATAASANATAPASTEREVRALLDEIYGPYASANAPGRDIGRFMEPQLADAMRRSQDGPDADPFLDAQDYAPFRPEIGPIRIAGDRAETDVRVRSLGERTIHYAFVRSAAGWKIADIRGPTSGSLRAHYHLPSSP